TPSLRVTRSVHVPTSPVAERTNSFTATQNCSSSKARAGLAQTVRRAAAANAARDRACMPYLVGGSSGAASCPLGHAAAHGSLSNHHASSPGHIQAKEGPLQLVVRSPMPLLRVIPVLVLLAAGVAACSDDSAAKDCGAPPSWRRQVEACTQVIADN